MVGEHAARRDRRVDVHPQPRRLRHRDRAGTGVELTDDYYPDTGKSTVDGVRTFVLQSGPPILTTDDILDAVASIDERTGTAEVYVAITLAPPAAERFANATEAWRGRRIAIIIDGLINTAPVVRTRIDGGRLSITMGAGDPEQQLAEAKRLASGLSGK